MLFILCTDILAIRFERNALMLLEFFARTDSQKYSFNKVKKKKTMQSTSTIWFNYYLYIYETTHDAFQFLWMTNASTHFSNILQTQRHGWYLTYTTSCMMQFFPFRLCIFFFILTLNSFDVCLPHSYILHFCTCIDTRFLIALPLYV